jgi:glycosyltransferase involved in cell wall biosynthesis
VPCRLVFIVRQFWPEIGREGKVMGELAAELAALGFQVTILTTRTEPWWPARIRFHEVPVVRLPYSPDGFWARRRYVRSLRRWLAEHRDRCDLVYVSGLRDEACAAVRAVGDRMPVVLRAETPGRFGDCVWQIDTRHGGKIKRACVKASGLVGPSRLLLRELQAAGYPRPRIHCIPNGVAIPAARTAETGASARAVLAESNPRLRPVDGAPVVVYAGRFETSKGIDHLIAAWKRVCARRPHARLWLAGDGPESPAIRRQVESLDLADQVIPLGVLSDIDLLLAAADLFVMPAVEAGPSLALLEAMAAATPLVAADTSGTREVMTDGVHGLLVPPGNVDAMSAAIGRLLDRRPEALQLGAAAREHVSRHFSLANMVREHVTLFENLAT